jgi:hypothetical protein
VGGRKRGLGGGRRGKKKRRRRRREEEKRRERGREEEERRGREVTTMTTTMTADVRMRDSQTASEGTSQLCVQTARKHCEQGRNKV